MKETARLSCCDTYTVYSFTYSYSRNEAALTIVTISSLCLLADAPRQP